MCYIVIAWFVPTLLAKMQLTTLVQLALLAVHGLILLSRACPSPVYYVSLMFLSIFYILSRLLVMDINDILIST